MISRVVSVGMIVPPLPAAAVVREVRLEKGSCELQ